MELIRQSGWNQNTFQELSVSRSIGSGVEGVAQTIEAMLALVDDAVKDPYVNRTAIEIVRQHVAFDPVSDLAAIFAWWQSQFRYVEDPVGPFGAKETLRPVRALLELRAGDCDDSSMALAALAGTIGYPTRFVTVAANPADPEAFSHVYTEALADGQWIPMDAARPGARFGRAPERYFKKWIWDANGHHDSSAGVGRVHGLSGYSVLGDVTPPNPFAQDVAASTTGVADIIAASNPGSTVYGNITPGGGGAINPYAVNPYAVNPYGANINTGLFSGSTTSPFLLLLLGLSLVLVMRR